MSLRQIAIAGTGIETRMPLEKWLDGQQKKYALGVSNVGR